MGCKLLRGALYFVTGLLSLFYINSDDFIAKQVEYSRIKRMCIFHELTVRGLPGSEAASAPCMGLPGNAEAPLATRLLKKEVGPGPTTFAARDASLYTHALYFEIYTPPLEGIELMSIAGYEAFVCVCFFAYKTLCASLLWPTSVGRP